MAAPDEKENVKFSLFTNILNHYQGFLTAFYALMIIIGALFDYFYYQRFGIDILKYASVFDFLVEPFKQPLIFIITSITIFLVWLIYRIDKSWQIKYPRFYYWLSMGWQHKWWYKYYLRLSFIFLFVCYLYYSAKVYGKIMHLRIEQSTQQITINFEDNKEHTGKLIGITGNFCFVQIDSAAYIFPLHTQVNFIKTPNKVKN